MVTGEYETSASSSRVYVDVQAVDREGVELLVAPSPNWRIANCDELFSQCESSRKFKREIWELWFKNGDLRWTQEVMNEVVNEEL